MGRSHKIWVDVSGGSGKSFGCGNDDITMRIQVGSSASNSNRLSTIQIKWNEDSKGNLSFKLVLDGQVYRTEGFDRKTKEFSGIEGFAINGSVEAQESRRKESATGMLNGLAAVMAMGEVLMDSQEEKNQWKAKMLKAGVPENAIHFPEDWNELSEDEKEKRLNKVIEVFSDKG